MSLAYYGIFSGFVVFVNDLPSITWDVFNFNLIRSSIKESFFGGRLAASLGDGNNPSNDVNKSNVLFMENKDKHKRKYSSSSGSAGVGGLYGNGNGNKVYSSNNSKGSAGAKGLYSKYVEVSKSNNVVDSSKNKAVRSTGLRYDGERQITPIYQGERSGVYPP